MSLLKFKDLITLTKNITWVYFCDYYYLTDHIYFAGESPTETEICSLLHLLRINYDGKQKN